MWMRRPRRRLEFPLPEPDEDLHLAHRLLGARTPLDFGILRALVGRPKRYSELQPLLGGRNDNNLNMALHRLRRDGLIRQRRDLSVSPHIVEYELSAKGIRVYELTFQFRPISETLAWFRRAEGVTAD